MSETISKIVTVVAVIVIIVMLVSYAEKKCSEDPNRDEKLVCNTVGLVDTVIKQVSNLADKEWLWVLSILAGPLALGAAAGFKVLRKRAGGGRDQYRPPKDPVVDPSKPKPKPKPTPTPKPKPPKPKPKPKPKPRIKAKGQFVGVNLASRFMLRGNMK